MILGLGCLKIDNDYIFWWSIISLVSSSGIIPPLIAFALPGRLFRLLKEASSILWHPVNHSIKGLSSHVGKYIFYKHCDLFIAPLSYNLGQNKWEI